MAQPPEQLAETFAALAAEWHRGAGHHSVWYHIRRHPAAQRIADLGWAAVPLILERLDTDPWIAWSFLLAEITQEQPVYRPERHGGFVGFDVRALAGAWRQWGRERRLLD